MSVNAQHPPISVWGAMVAASLVVSLAIGGADGNLWFTALGAPAAVSRITPSGLPGRYRSVVALALG
jgi:hypothetical protein